MTKSEFHLTDIQLEALSRAVRESPCPRQQRRAQALKLLAEGHALADVADGAGVAVRAVKDWVRRYKTEGLDGLHDRHRSGRPPKASAGFIKLLESALAQLPEDMGFDDQAGWTVTMLRAYLENATGIDLSDGRMRALLHRLGYRYRQQPSLLQDKLPPFPTGDYQQLKVYLELESRLRERLPEHHLKPFSTWVKVEEA